MLLLMALYITVCVHVVAAQRVASEDDFLAKVSEPETILGYLNDLSERPSLAGTPGSLDDALYSLRRFEEWGVPDARLAEYDTLMSYPVSRSLTRLTPSLFNAALEEPVLTEDPTSGDPDISMTFLAYAATGNVTAECVYVNYGRPEDFDLLEEAGVALAGKIAIARYGEMFRGLKVKEAQEHGMIGAVLYSDPADDGASLGATYPDGMWRNPDGVQMGSAWFLNLFAGDSLTPFTAALPGLDAADKKYTYENTPTVPRIPAIPVSANDAQPFLEAMAGIDVTSDPRFEGWQGGYPFAYHTGGSDGVTANLDVVMEHPIRRLYDAIATFPGEEEPDRQVLAGGHRDGWVFGTIDPHAGTAPLYEITRVFADMWREGWRPRRTIRIGSWDGEEFGLLGSTEWVEDNQDELIEQGVVYFNVDGSAAGPNFSLGGSPSLGDFMRDVTRSITNPSTGNTVFEDWAGNGTGTIGNLGSGSDYTAFLDFLGISSIDMGFRGQGGGTYHSKFDSVEYYRRFVDKIYLQLTAKVLGLSVLRMADAEVLPFDHREYAEALSNYQDDLERLFSSNDISLDLTDLFEAVDAFRVSAERAASAQTSDMTAAELRAHNDRLMFTERGFLALDQPTLYKRDEGWYRHTIYAPSFAYGYSGVIFPGPTEAAQDRNLEETRIQLAVLVDQIHRAAEILSE